jgi:DNA polymerase-3 subunit delta
MKIDAARAAAFATVWPAEVRLLLLHGPDESASRDLARQIAAAQAAAGAGVTEFIGAALKDDPQALVAAVTSLSMFGDRELLRLDGLDEDGLYAVQALLAGPQGHPVLAVAGNLKKGSKLLALAEREAAIAACVQYEASLRDAPRLLADMAAPLGLRLDREVAESLFERAAGDRMVMRAELEKFALYKNALPDAPQRLTLEDLAALGISLGEAELFAPVGAITVGDVKAVVDQVTRLPDGVAIPLLRALERRLATLVQLRAEVDSGRPPAAVVDAAGRAIFFREKPFYIKALTLWDQGALAAALADVLAAERAVKASGGLADLGVQERLLALTRRAAAKAQRSR